MSNCHVDEAGALHCENGPAMAYRDGTELWVIHGVRVDRQVVVAPHALTVDRIRGEENAEVRRVMLDRFGWDRYLRESDAELLDEVHEPPFPGLLDAKLWRAEIPGDEPLLMVVCRNSTPEPDGSYKPYMLRVPPDMRSAHEAAAWTFQMDAADYEPVAES